MANETDNIELRSEKVRNIIGQIPPRIIRTGISLIFLIIVGILIGSYFFEYEETIKTTASLESFSGKMVGKLEVPANEIGKIRPNLVVRINFDNIQHLYNERIECKISTVSDKLIIDGSGGYYFGNLLLPDTLRTTIGKEIEIIEKITANAEIVVEKKRLLLRLMEPFKSLFRAAG